MLANSLFKADELLKFKQIIQNYLESMNYHDFILTDDELAQLNWYMSDSSVTPEAHGKDIIDKLNFEIKRSLTRRYSLELLLRGDAAAYEEFIRGQNKTAILPFTAFKILSAEAQSLDENIKTVVKTSCFLASSDKAKEVLKAAGYVLSDDTEEFLTQLIPVLQKNKAIFPLTKNLTEAELQLLQKVYWPNMHFRHMLFTEGGDNMTKTFSDARSRGNFGTQDFLAWKWRWLTNLFGFKGGQGANCDAETHYLAATVMQELKLILEDPKHAYLDRYLLKRAEYAGFRERFCSYLDHLLSKCSEFPDNYEIPDLSETEQQLLGHLAAYCHQINVLTPAVGRMIYEGYIEFQKEFDDTGRLAEKYKAKRKDEATITPTYVPAIINNAYLIFKDVEKMDAAASLKNATQLMCQILRELYDLPHDKRIACNNFAREKNMQIIIEKWMVDHHAVEFKLNENSELIATDARSLRSLRSMNPALLY